MAKIKYILAGTTSIRPPAVVVGFEFFNTTTGQLEIWNGTSYQAACSSATISSKGLVNQSSASADTATTPSATYTQAEVTSILTELRDLKTKLRTAGILAL